MATRMIDELANLGPKSQAMLAKVGVETRAQLKKLGAVAAYVRAKRVDHAVSLNLLYGLVASLEKTHWREIQRHRKLELLAAVEAYEKAHRISNEKSDDKLSQLRNIGKAMRKDFDVLGIGSVEQLAKCRADELFARIQDLTGLRHDPCVWDTYAAAIHQAKTGEALPWWEFTKIRKERECNGTWIVDAKSPRNRPRKWSGAK